MTKRGFILMIKFAITGNIASGKSLVEFLFHKEGITTRKDYVADLVDALRTINNTTKIYIGEGEGGYNSFSMSDAMRVMGFYEIAQKHSNVEIINLSQMEIGFIPKVRDAES